MFAKQQAKVSCDRAKGRAQLGHHNPMPDGANAACRTSPDFNPFLRCVPYNLVADEGLGQRTRERGGEIAFLGLRCEADISHANSCS